MMCKHQFEISRHEVLLSDIEGDSEGDVFRYSLFRLIVYLGLMFHEFAAILLHTYEPEVPTRGFVTNFQS